MKLLMHICCAGCGIFPITHLASKGVDVRGLWFNPNIHPEDEYRKRLDALKALDALWGLEVQYVDRYGLDDFLRLLEGHEGLRCIRCYERRLGETALTAKKMGLDGFTTTLLSSPYQRFDLIADIGMRLGREHSIDFYLEDFRPGWKEGVRASRELGLYRQKYCGCVFSRDERFKKGPAP